MLCTALKSLSSACTHTHTHIRGEHEMLSCMVQTFAGELICIWNYITITEHKCSICQLQGDERGKGVVVG